jgi:hypothetical protein
VVEDMGSSPHHQAVDPRAPDPVIRGEDRGRPAGQRPVAWRKRRQLRWPLDQRHAINMRLADQEPLAGPAFVGPAFDPAVYGTAWGVTVDGFWAAKPAMLSCSIAVQS